MPNDYPDNDEEWERERAEEEADRIRKEEPPPNIDQAEFLTWRSPREVSGNPTRLDNPLWQWMVRTRWDAYNANKLFAGPSSFDAGPMWTFQRFGSSVTSLDDGRVIYIGGEHEDHYDPDFYIYNDVTIVNADGEISIYCYPREDFPPTDFHSATRVGNSIYLIGRLGYEGSCVRDVTPVYKLCLDSMQIEAKQTTGTPPGWVYRHTASLLDDGHTIIISAGERWLGKDSATRENVDSWAFDTLTAKWQQLTKHNWQHWVMQQVDRKPNRLWDIRQAQWHRDHAHLGLEDHWSYSDEPNFAALDKLYRMSDESDPPTQGAESGTFRVVIDGLTVRFKEDRFWVEAIVEGQLCESRLATLQQSTLTLLEQLNAAPYEIEQERDGMSSKL
jgi:hypothetical protein